MKTGTEIPAAGPAPDPAGSPQPFRVSVRALLAAALVCGVLSALLYELARHDCARAIRSTPDRDWVAGGISIGWIQHEDLQVRYFFGAVAVGMLLCGVLSGAATRRERWVVRGTVAGLLAAVIALLLAWRHGILTLGGRLWLLPAPGVLVLGWLVAGAARARTFRRALLWSAAIALVLSAVVEWWVAPREGGSLAVSLAIVPLVLAALAACERAPSGGGGLRRLAAGFIPGVLVYCALLPLLLGALVDSGDCWPEARISSALRRAADAGALVRIMALPMTLVGLMAAINMLACGWVVAGCASVSAGADEVRPWRRLLWPFERRTRTPSGVVGEGGERLLPMRFGLKGLLAFILFVTALHAVFFLQERWRVTVEVKGCTRSGSAPFVTPGARRFVTAAGGVWLYDLDSGREVRELSVGTEFAYFAAVSPDGRRIVAATLEGSVFLWDAGSGEALARFRADVPEGGESDLSFAPRGRLCVVAMGGEALVFDAEAGRELHRVSGGSFCPVFSPDGELLGVSPAGDVFGVVDARTGEDLWSARWDAKVGGFSLRSARFSPDGDELLVSDSFGETRVFDAATGRERKDSPAAKLLHPIFSPDGRYLAGLRPEDHCGKAYNLGPVTLLDLGGPEPRLVFSANWSIMFEGLLRGGLNVLDATGGNVTRCDVAESVALTPAGGFVFVRADERAVYLREEPGSRWMDRVELDADDFDYEVALDHVYGVAFVGSRVWLFTNHVGEGRCRVRRRRYPPGPWGHLHRPEIWAAVLLGAAWLWMIARWLRENSGGAKENVIQDRGPAT